MSQNFERAKSRLENISSIEPLLGALRTLSMGTWQMALKKIAQIEAFEENYDHILNEILPQIKKPSAHHLKSKEKNVEIADTVFLMIGTERGLCGKFNETLIDNSNRWIKDQNYPSYQIWVMGSRLIRKMEQRGINFSWRKPLPASDITTYQQAYVTTQKWIDQFESYDFNQLVIFYNQLVTGGNYQFSSFQLLPYKNEPLQIEKSETPSKWPPPIIETDPDGIYRLIIQNHVASSFYRILLKSAAAEHAARFNLMEEAKDNADEIIRELRQIINAERKRQITQEMQELAAGSGLLDNQ